MILLVAAGAMRCTYSRFCLSFCDDEFVFAAVLFSAFVVTFPSRRACCVAGDDDVGLGAYTGAGRKIADA